MIEDMHPTALLGSSANTHPFVALPASFGETIARTFAFATFCVLPLVAIGVVVVLWLRQRAKGGTSLELVQALFLRWMARDTFSLHRMCFLLALLGLIVLMLAYQNRLYFRDYSADLQPLPAVRLRAQPVQIASYPTFRGDVSQTELEDFLSLLEPFWNSPRIYDVLHALRLWGTRAEFPPIANFLGVSKCSIKPIHSRELLSFFLDEWKFKHAFPTVPHLFRRSRYGVGARNDGSPFAMQHHDDFLSLAAEIGLPIETPLRLEREVVTLKDLFHNAFQTFTTEQDMEFTAVGYACYLSPGSAWENRFGERFELNDIVERLLDKKQQDLACYGTHVPYSLSVLLAVDKLDPILKPVVRRRVENRLREISRTLEHTQGAAGWWDRKWNPQWAALQPAFENEATELVRATGHHLEWIALVPPALRPSDATVRKAIRFLVQSAKTYAADNPTLARDFGPYSHAGRALVLLTGELDAVGRMKNAWERRKHAWRRP